MKDFVLRKNGKEVSQGYINMFASKILIANNRKEGKASDSFSGGYNLIESLYSYADKEKLNKDSEILIINDIAFQGVYFLLNQGYKNITIAYTSEKVLSNIKFTQRIYCIYNTKINIINFKYIKGMKFDLIISNPPYAIGNEITKNIIEEVKFKEFVNLMPLSRYKKNDLYNYIDISKPINSFLWSCENAEVSTAIVSICDHKVNELIYDEFMINSYTEEFRKFYKLNYITYTQKYQFDYISVNSGNKVTQEELNNNYYFCIPKRTSQNGVHITTNCLDYDFNIKGEKDGVKPHDQTISRPACFIKFDSPIKTNNFKIFWYKNNLMHKLIKGLNKTGGSYLPAIPNIDYSVDRDYEHLTLDEIINILKELQRSQL